MMEIKHIKSMFLFLLLFGIISCQAGKDKCTSISFGNDETRLYIKPFFPALADGSAKRSDNSASANGHIHFVIRVEKKTAFTTEQSEHLRDAIKNDISLKNNGLELTRSLFIYEALFPSDNLAQFVIAYANPGGEIDGQYSLNLSSEIFEMRNQSIDIPKDCLQ